MKTHKRLWIFYVINLINSSVKGGEFCIIRTEDFISAGLAHLSNRNTYELVSHITPQTIELLKRDWTMNGEE